MRSTPSAFEVMVAVTVIGAALAPEASGAAFVQTLPEHAYPEPLIETAESPGGGTSVTDHPPSASLGPLFLGVSV